MRLRKIKGADEAVATSPYVIHEDLEAPNDWHKIFNNDHPLHVEIGMGKGKFIIELAQRHPQINYLGIERYPSVLLHGIKKQESLQLPNLYFLCLDARILPEIFAPEEVSRIYLNFSDPWPKDRHAKRRLTSPAFMTVYDQILEKNGFIEFKTDNQKLFSYSLESIPSSGWKITESTYDLHHSAMALDNVMTEYETKFSSLGNPICKLIAKR